jgi:ABC-type nitrate/sulfonate/bicarbonate transport system ATPase subunit
LFTLLKNLEIPLLIKGVSEKETREKVLELLPQFGLKGFENNFPNALSGGMYQRAALFRTLLTGADLLFSRLCQFELNFGILCLKK